MSELTNYYSANGQISILVRTDYIKGNSERTFINAKVITSGVKVNGRACEKMLTLSGDRLRDYGMFFKIPLYEQSKRKRKIEAKKYIEDRLEKVLNRLIQDGLITFN